MQEVTTSIQSTMNALEARLDELRKEMIHSRWQGPQNPSQRTTIFFNPLFSNEDRNMKAIPLIHSLL